MAKDIKTRLRLLEQSAAFHAYLVGILLSLILVDTIALGVLWGEKGKPDFDHIAVSLTVFQTLFGIAALYGFWALRGLTRDRAGEVAREVAEQITRELARNAVEQVAKREIRELAPPIILRFVKEAEETFRAEGTISDAASDQMVAALDGKEGGDGQ